MTEGQAWALSQLRDIESQNAALEIISVAEPTQDKADLCVEISIACDGYERAVGGLPLRARERFLLRVPANFPLALPTLDFRDTRFGDFAHVQWGTHLCLYQAPDTEWQPSDGMFGFFDRLDLWLELGSLGQLDPIGLPLHPPAVYTTRSETIVPCVNAPAVESPWWVGYVEIARQTQCALFLGKWHAYDATVPEVKLAGAVLLPSRMPYEYPTTMGKLFELLEARDVPRDILKIIVELTALRGAEDKPIYIVLGAAMRGIAGADERLQHLACWCIPAERVNVLRKRLLESEKNVSGPPEHNLSEWAADTPIQWCAVRENRPEIVTRRDVDTPLQWWHGKSVIMLGCGALGSAISEMIVRAGAKHLRLFDRACVSPGILVRQGFDYQHIGCTKASALKVRLAAINPEADITDVHGDIIRLLDSAELDRILAADVIVNATASASLATALEKMLAGVTPRRPPVVSVEISHRAQFGLAAKSPHDWPTATIGIDRKLKLAIANAPGAQSYLDEFWPTKSDRKRGFQPEPGCSDPTFVGSYADVLSLSAQLLNVCSEWLAEGSGVARGCVLRSPQQQAPTEVGIIAFGWHRDRQLEDRRRGFRIQVTRDVERDLLAWIRSSARIAGASAETGGLLFGEINEYLGVVWIDEVSGPPPDSKASPSEFECGVLGTRELHEEKIRRTRGSVRFIGMWHTHPGGTATPSAVDLEAMTRLRLIPAEAPRNFLMLIIGGTMPEVHMEGYVFER